MTGARQDRSRRAPHTQPRHTPANRQGARGVRDQQGGSPRPDHSHGDHEVPRRRRRRRRGRADRRRKRGRRVEETAGAAVDATPSLRAQRAYGRGDRFRIEPIRRPARVPRWRSLGVRALVEARQPRELLPVVEGIARSRAMRRRGGRCGHLHDRDVRSRGR